MTNTIIELMPTGVKGSLALPPSKSHTLRAILFGSLAGGTSHIENILDSPDTDAMILACQTLGARIKRHDSSLQITGGINRDLKTAYIDAQNSGIVLRFMAAVCALTGAVATVTGDESCQTRRPCKPLLDALGQMGSRTFSHNGLAPFTVQGPIHPCKVVMDGQDSQPVSAIMIAAAMLVGTTEICVLKSGEKPWLALTLDWLKRVGIEAQETAKDCYTVEGRGEIASFCYRVPADLSSLAFPVALALITESELVIEDVDLSDVQGDKELLAILERMGARFVFGDKTISIKGPQKLQGCAIDCNDCIDALPILAVLGCFAEGTTRLYNAAIARKKESDRIAVMKLELTKMGACIIEHVDGLSITKSDLHGASLDSHKDHRVAMSLAVAALGARGKSHLAGAECVNKTYKNFFVDIERLKDNVC